jgi:perosamine synthetase
MRPVTKPAREVPIAGPSITEHEIDYVRDAVTRAWYGNANEFHERFESAFAAHVGRRHAIALPSCTAALHLTLLSLGVGPGDEVILPDVTWIASAAPVLYVGATPVFADIDPTTWCLDLARIEEAITPRTKAVIAVDLYGGMPDLPGLERLLGERGIPLIEDAAEAIGSEIGSSPAGSFGVAATFSFHGSKTVTTGEGGMLVTDDDELWRRSLFLRDHGRNPGDTSFRSTEVAYKYKMSSMQAALGLAQLERVAELVEQKRAIFSWYRDAITAGPLGSSGAVTLNAEPEGTTNSYWMITAILSPELGWKKERLMPKLREQGIATRPFFDPLSSLEPFRESEAGRAAATRNTVSYALAPYGINLPSALSVTQDDVAYVCEQFAAVLGLGAG